MKSCQIDHWQKVMGLSSVKHPDGQAHFGLGYMLLLFSLSVVFVGDCYVFEDGLIPHLCFDGF